MPSREILESHPVRVLRAEVAKANKALMIINLSSNRKRLTKSQLIDRMMEHKDRFHHIKMAVKAAPKAPAAKAAKAPKAPKAAKSSGKSNVKIELAGPISNARTVVTLSKAQVEGKAPLRVTKAQLQSLIKSPKK
tara:strand:- start:353 stop:757 length:405 start_codon:yes stop_codon:yes gene_type:complete